MGLKGRKRETVKGKVQWIMLPVWTVGTHGKELRFDSNNAQQLWAVGNTAKSGKQTEKRKDKMGKGWWWKSAREWKGKIIPEHEGMGRMGPDR